MNKNPDSLPSSAGAMTPEMQDALATLCLPLLPIWSRQLATSREQSEQAVGKMLSAFNAINQVLEQLLPEGGTTAQSLQPHIDQMLVGLQYQDRIGQMMALLQDDISRLHGVLENPTQDASALAVQSWLERLESLYAMAEQRRDHGKAGAGAESLHDDGTSFF
ncbi:MAG: hypothetical protein Q8R72_15785 [Hylemonella sp.]|nr:hypothetical protein [Hylemonella sp.]